PSQSGDASIVHKWAEVTPSRTLCVPGLVAIAGLADLSDQSCRWYRGNRPLRAADDNVPAALLPGDLRHSISARYAWKPMGLALRGNRLGNNPGPPARFGASLKRQMKSLAYDNFHGNR